MIEITANLLKRFWSKVDGRGPNECWEWTASKFHGGYGMIKINGRIEYAHRVSWIIHNDSIPDNLCVCHACDVPACCNPNHLWLGTHADNMKDKAGKKRVVVPNLRGEKNPSSKLTWEQVRIIRRDYDTGNFSQRELANRYGVTQQNISSIITGTRWKTL